MQGAGMTFTDKLKDAVAPKYRIITRKSKNKLRMLDWAVVDGNDREVFVSSTEQAANHMLKIFKEFG